MNIAEAFAQGALMARHMRAGLTGAAQDIQLNGNWVYGLIERQRDHERCAPHMQWLGFIPRPVR